MKFEKNVFIAFIIVAILIFANIFSIALAEVSDEQVLWRTSYDGNQQYQTNSFGAFTKSIIVNSPPGRNGIEPKITINYSSYGKNGVLGVGWDLNMGYIQRSTKNGIDYLKSSNGFVFVSNGASAELVRRNEWGSNMYGYRIESTFSRFELLFPNDGWVVTDRNGTKYYYGYRVDANSQMWNEDSSNPKVFRWYLDNVVDLYGNYMEVNYTPKSPENNFVLLDNIKYTGNSDVEPNNIIEFIYNGSRDDVISDCSPNFKTTSDRLLKIIKITAKNKGITNETVGLYGFKYTNSLETHQSLLTSIQECGRGADITAFNEVSAADDQKLPPIGCIRKFLKNEFNSPFQEIFRQFSFVSIFVVFDNPVICTVILRTS